ncbi:hypothetical protein PV726_49125 [Streptomyces europaeiscabiei]|uniref:hypothetical protein n=1 Tax=Streptomyces europaeiscabiei TaxID=146819 RepID=UPI0029B2DFB1|nr:hypothetical protein [Streptomyces europaeiscabiei]MDX3697977.1 hypothetical protein [Streptomyces europaeiscabiei]
MKVPVPQLYTTLIQKAHAILCDASREGLRLYYNRAGGAGCGGMGPVSVGDAGP